MAAPLYYSAEMVRALPDDGNRYETVHGELLVTPAPAAPHQLVAGRLFRLLSEHLDRNSVGLAMMSPADISWSPDTLVQPDVFVVALNEARTLEWARMRTLLLAVEVLSPSTAHHDRFTKRRVYQEVGVATYWVVDGVARSVEVWTPEAPFPQTVTDALEWRPTEATETLTISLESLFRPI